MPETQIFPFLRVVLEPTGQWLIGRMLVIEHREPALKISGLVVEADEKTNKFRFDGAIDGKPYTGDVGARSYRRVDGRTVDSAFRSTDGRYTEQSRTSISADGKRLTRTIELDRAGEKLKWTEVYDRQP